MSRILLSLLLLIIFPPAIRAQSGGEGVFNFLRLTNSAQSAALGGVQVALTGAEPALVIANPALLNGGMSQSLSVNYSSYLAGIGFGCGTYAKDFGKFGMAAIGIQFVDYGQFVAADENGVITGSFSAADYAMVFTYSYQVGHLFTVGTSVKPIYSHLESYSSYGISTDLGIAHHSADGLTTFAFCLKELGTQLRPYYDNGTREKMICSIQAGVYHRLEHAPFGLAITAYDLNKWEQAVVATDPNELPVAASKTSLLAAVMRHLSIGAELFPENKLTFRIGYNYRRAVDLAVVNSSTFTGFTAGLGLSLNSFRLNYALSGYSHSGMVHNFSLTSNFGKLFRK